MANIILKEVCCETKSNQTTIRLVKLTEKRFLEQEDVCDKLDLSVYLNGPIKKLTLLDLPNDQTYTLNINNCVTLDSHLENDFQVFDFSNNDENYSMMRKICVGIDNSLMTLEQNDLSLNFSRLDTSFLSPKPDTSFKLRVDGFEKKEDKYNYYEYFQILDINPNNIFNAYFLRLPVYDFKVVNPDMSLNPVILTNRSRLESVNNSFDFSTHNNNNNNINNDKSAFVRDLLSWFPDKVEEVIKNTYNFSLSHKNFLQFEKELDTPVKLQLSYYNIEMDNGAGSVCYRFSC